jgi:hypothetical protein
MCVFTRYPVTGHENWVFCAFKRRSFVRFDKSAVGIKKCDLDLQAKFYF